MYFSYLLNASVKDSCKSPPWVFQLPNPLKQNTNYTFQVFKGTHIKTVLSSKDASFIANSSISKAYYSWIKNMKMSAEEHHTATLLRLNVDDQNVSFIFFDLFYIFSVFILTHNIFLSIKIKSYLKYNRI